jgi:hypothetical protein
VRLAPWKSAHPRNTLACMITPCWNFCLAQATSKELIRYQHLYKCLLLNFLFGHTFQALTFSPREVQQAVRISNPHNQIFAL